MPDITITIPTPILTGSDTFLVRYRALPAGAWSSHTTQTNAPFTLTGLAVGLYQLEVIVVKDGVECPAITKQFEIIAEYECIEFEAELVQTSAGLYNIEISYTIPSPLVNPPCGYIIEIRGKSTKTITYATLPASPIKIQVLNEPMLVRVIADLCNGKRENCYEADITMLPPNCTPIVITDTSVAQLMGAPFFGTRFRIFFQITQSTPVTNYMVVLIQQKASAVISGNVGQTSYASFNPLNITNTPTQFFVDIDANLNIYGTLMEFDYMLQDYCGKKHTGTVSITI